MSKPHADRLHALLVDDEPLALQLLSDVVGSIPEVARVSKCRDGVQAVEAIRAEAPDLVLLDIAMPEVDGFDVIAEVGVRRMPYVIFVTAFDHYSLRAFEVNAVDYILKPYDASRVQRAVSIASARIAADESTALAERLTRLLVQRSEGESAKTRHARRLTVPDGERFRFVDVHDIHWIEVNGNYVTLRTDDGDHRIRSTLTSLLERLNPSLFVRIHRSAAVNLEHVKEVQPWFGGDQIVILRGGRQLRVSRTHKARLLALFH